MIDGYDTAGLVVATAYTALGAAIALAIGFRPLGRRVAEWSAVRGVPLTPETQPLIEARLRRARRFRTVGFTIGWCAPYASMWWTRSAYDVPLSGNASVLTMAAGYIFGALAAEAWASRTARPSGAASLDAREFGAYLPRNTRRWTWAAVAVGFALLPLHSVAYGNEHWPPPSTGSLVARALVLFAVLVAAEALPRALVARPQPFESGDLLDADDALRSWSAHAIGAALLALALLIISEQVWNLAVGSGIGVLTWIGVPASLVIGAVGIASFQHLSDYRWRWRVQRSAA